MRAAPLPGVSLFFVFALGGPVAAADPPGDRLRVFVETDAGGDPDDEQSLVRFLLYVNEWDVEGIIANRPEVRKFENHSPERTGLGVVQRLIKAYGECYPSLVKHDPRYPKAEALLERTVAGYDDTDAGVKLLIATVDKDDPRPLWYSDWGTDKGASKNNLKRALDRVLNERGPAGYARFKSKLRLSTSDQFEDHTFKIEPAFPILIAASKPELNKQRWYWRFSAITATAGGFDLKRDVLTGHGPLGALYPTNTTHPQKEGDSMYFLYLVPTGMNDPDQPTWGSWAGRYGKMEHAGDRPYYWANLPDTWLGTTHRENTLRRWAADLQNDFRARLDWCVQPPAKANHRPVVVVNGHKGLAVVYEKVRAGTTVELNAADSTDPDGDALKYEWQVYPEAGTFAGKVTIAGADTPKASASLPPEAVGKTVHIVLTVRDAGSPPLVGYRRVVFRCESDRQ